MIQEAILVTENNIPAIADSVVDYTAEDIQEEIGYMLRSSIKPVFVRNVHSSGVATTSHIVSVSMFYSNVTTTSELNDQTYVQVVQL